MAKKKKGYQQALNEVSGAAQSSKTVMQTKLGVDESIKGRRALSGQNQKIFLTNYETNFLKLLALKTNQSSNQTETSTFQNLNKQINELANKLLEGCNLTDVKTDFTSLNISQNDTELQDQTYYDEFLLQTACFLFLSPIFQSIKKHVLHVLLQLDENRVLRGLEDQLTDFLGDDDFEMRSVDTLSIQELMREFEYKIIVYFEIYHRIVEQNPLESDEQDQAKMKNKSKYQPQNSLLRLLQIKISFILSRQRHSYLEKKGFVMNHSSTKTLVEFLHSYLNLLNRFGEDIEINLNNEGINFVCEYLVNPRSQRDILTQSSIIFWILFRINFNKIAKEADKKVSMSEQICFLVQTMEENVDLNYLFQNQNNFQNQKLEIGQRGILQMAKIRGFILTQDKSIDIISQLNLKGTEFQEIKKLIKFPNEESDFFDLVLLNCEKNEGLQKLYAFHTLESIISRLQSLQTLQEGQALQRLVHLIIKNLEYPLHSVCSCCESILKRVLQVGTQEQGKEILQVIMGLNSQQEIRSKYTALNLVITQSNSIQFLTENPHVVREMISLAGESILLGKYLLTFFESVLRKAYDSCTQTNKQEQWYDFWIQEYLNVLNSDNEDLRIAVSTHITPIVVKINRLSLALILSKYMQKLKNKIDNNPISSLGVGILEQLLTLLKVARQNKMLRICDDTQDVQLEQSVQEALFVIEGKSNNSHFSILQSDLLRLVHTQNWKMSLECFQIAAIDVKVVGAAGQQRDNLIEANAGTITKFEYEMANCFLKNCTRTTFPEYRQNFMKAARSFLTRVRGTNLKEIKKYVEGQTEIQGELQKLVNFLRQIIEYCTQNLYLDKPIESALPFFEILRMLQELFGDEDYHVRITHVLPKTCLLSKVGLLQDKDFIIFLLSCLKSSWVQIRLQAYELLVKMPIKKNNQTSLDEIEDGPDLLGCPVFVNDVILKTAMDLINSPKAMIAEGGSLMLKFIFQKCLVSVHFIQSLNDDESAISFSMKQLAFCQHILCLIKDRSKIFIQTLIGEGKTVAMLHGLLGFFKNLLLDFNISQVQQKVGQVFTQQENYLFEQWRLFVKEFISVSIDVSKHCSQLLSNNRLEGLDEAQGQLDTGNITLEVDCRGHPMTQRELDINEGNSGDYENLILVGVWLSVKENGLAMFNLLKWLEMPGGQQDQTKFLGENDIIQLCQNLVQMLFSFKHRGAIEKTAESFSLLCTKLLNSNWKVLQQIPEGLLDEALDRITKEIHSTVLRRSAGIPPTIIAILRAEPLSNEPIFLNKTLNFLIKLGQESTDHEDKKIHALNIMRFIFQDAFLKHDIAKFITPAMILATENFQSDNWSIRNSALMCFTVLTKRLLGTYLVQEQDLTRKKGLSIWEFVNKFSDLSDYFKKVLRNNIENINNKNQSQSNAKEQQEKKDMVVFSILLLISRLVPAFQLIDSSLKSNDSNNEDQDEEENKVDQYQLIQEKSREESIQEFIALIKGYSKSGTYFVRKISAQALLPIISFDDYVVNICQSLKNLTEKMQGKVKLKQNEAHGLMLRTSIFLRAFFTYKDQTQVILGRSNEEQEKLRQLDIQKIKNSFNDFYKSLPDKNGIWYLSKVTIALFIKQLRFLAKQQGCLDLDYINQLSKSVQIKLIDLFQVIRDKSDNQLEDNILFKDLIKLSFVLDQQLGCEFISEFTRNHIFLENSFIENHIDLCYKVLKTAYSRLKKEQNRNSSPWQALAIKLSEVQIPWLLNKHNEQFCKVLEFSLKIIHRVFKYSVQDLQDKVSCLQPLLSDIIQKFSANCHLTSLFIKISTLFASHERSIDNLAEIGQILLKFAHGEQKEIVRVAAVKSLGKFLKYIQFNGKTGKLKSSHDIWKAVILLLNDEHPEVRSYLIQSQGMLQFVNSQMYSINSVALTPSFEKNNNDQRLVVDINEQMMIEAIFEILGKLSDEQLKETGESDLIQNFLKPTFIEGQGWYRDHISKNFEEKIFNFEPANKYYDLLWIKRIVYKIIIKVKNIKLQLISQKVESKDFVLMIKENSTEAEEKTSKIINLILSASKESPSLSSSQRAFNLSLYSQ